MTKTSRALAAIGAGVALAGSIAGGAAVLLGIGGDVALVRADVSRHEQQLAATTQSVRTLELGIVVLPAQLSELVHRLDDITRRLERLEPSRGAQ